MTSAVVHYNSDATPTRVCKYTAAYDTSTFSLSCPSPRVCDGGGGTV